MVFVWNVLRNIKKKKKRKHQINHNRLKFIWARDMWHSNLCHSHLETIRKMFSFFQKIVYFSSHRKYIKKNIKSVLNGWVIKINFYLLLTEIFFEIVPLNWWMENYSIILQVISLVYECRVQFHRNYDTYDSYSMCDQQVYKRH